MIGEGLGPAGGARLGIAFDREAMIQYDIKEARADKNKDLRTSRNELVLCALNKFASLLLLGLAERTKFAKP